MRAANFTGNVQFNVDDISACTFDFSVPVEDLRVDETVMRQYVDMETV